MISDCCMWKSINLLNVMWVTSLLESSQRYSGSFSRHPNHSCNALYSTSGLDAWAKEGKERRRLLVGYLAEGEEERDRKIDARPWLS
jgi:hypothetical protein